VPTLPMIPLPRNDRWMDAKEVAALFGVDRETVHRWGREKKLKGYQPAKKKFFKKSDVNKLLKTKGLPQLE